MGYVIQLLAERYVDEVVQLKLWNGDGSILGERDEHIGGSAGAAENPMAGRWAYSVIGSDGVFAKVDLNRNEVSCLWGVLAHKYRLERNLTRKVKSQIVASKPRKQAHITKVVISQILRRSHSQDARRRAKIFG